MNQNLASYQQTGRIIALPNCLSRTYGVRFKNWHDKGLVDLFISPRNLQLYNEEKHDTQEDAAMSNIVTGNYKVATVRFMNGDNYKNYVFALFDDQVEVNDLVLCDTANGYHVAYVNSITDKDQYRGHPVTREVICKIDLSAFNHRKEVREQKLRLKEKMDQMVADNQELILYQAIAEKNPVMAELLEAYKKLGGF